MKTFVASSLLLVGAESAVSELTFDVAAAKNRPVTKVITLLKDMLKQLEKEAEEDEEIYDQLACWCETNDKEKTKSIADAEAKIEDLTNKIEELTASSARLATEIKNLEKEVARIKKHWMLPPPSARRNLPSSMRRRKIRSRQFLL